MKSLVKYHFMKVTNHFSTINMIMINLWKIYFSNVIPLKYKLRSLKPSVKEITWLLQMFSKSNVLSERRIIPINSCKTLTFFLQIIKYICTIKLSIIKGNIYKMQLLWYEILKSGSVFLILEKIESKKNWVYNVLWFKIISSKETSAFNPRAMCRDSKNHHKLWRS